MGDNTSTADTTVGGAASGRTLANKAVLNQLHIRVTANPSTDLGEALKQQLASYPSLVQALTPASRTTQPRSPSPVDEPAFVISAEDAVDIIHTLSEDVVAKLTPSEPTEQPATFANHLPQALVNKFNHLLRAGEVLHALHENWVIKVDADTVVKVGSAMDPDHISNLQYINEHMPGVPAPRFLGSLRRGRFSYVFLSRGRGVTLESAWPDLTVAQKGSIRLQLTEIFRTIRAACPREEDAQLHLGGFKSGVVKDMRRWQRVSNEPLATIADFNDFICRSKERASTAWIEMVRSSMRDDYNIVMTHGDLHPRNIMVEIDKEANEAAETRIQVTSILDWELAGWYPEHWEFVRALNTIDVRGPLRDWIDYLPTEAIGMFPVEYSLDCLLGRWLG